MSVIVYTVKGDRFYEMVWQAPKSEYIHTRAYGRDLNPREIHIDSGDPRGSTHLVAPPPNDIYLLENMHDAPLFS